MAGTNRSTQRHLKLLNFLDNWTFKIQYLSGKRNINDTYKTTNKDHTHTERPIRSTSVTTYSALFLFTL